MLPKNQFKYKYYQTNRFLKKYFILKYFNTKYFITNDSDTKCFRNKIFTAKKIVLLSTTAHYVHDCKFECFLTSKCNKRSFFSITSVSVIVRDIKLSSQFVANPLGFELMISVPEGSFHFGLDPNKRLKLLKLCQILSNKICGLFTKFRY